MKKYAAFISYARADEKNAVWLHAQLEKYRVPNIALAGGSVFTKGQWIRPVFLDKAELPASSNLNETLIEALDQAEYLIVIASPHAAISKWVNAEVRHFIATGRRERIIYLVVAGEPLAISNNFDEALEAFPPATLEVVESNGEPLWADLRANADGRSLAYAKIVAGLIGTSVDVVLQREKQRRRRAIAGALVTLAVLALPVLAYVWHLQEQSNISQLETRIEEIRNLRFAGQNDQVITELAEQLKWLEAKNLQPPVSLIREMNEILLARPLQTNMGNSDLFADLELVKATNGAAGEKMQAVQSSEGVLLALRTFEKGDTTTERKSFVTLVNFNKQKIIRNFPSPEYLSTVFSLGMGGQVLVICDQYGSKGCKLHFPLEERDPVTIKLPENTYLSTNPVISDQNGIVVFPLGHSGAPDKNELLIINLNNQDDDARIPIPSGGIRLAISQNGKEIAYFDRQRVVFYKLADGKWASSSLPLEKPSDLDQSAGVPADDFVINFERQRLVYSNNRTPQVIDYKWTSNAASEIARIPLASCQCHILGLSGNGNILKTYGSTEEPRWHNHLKTYTFSSELSLGGVSRQKNIRIGRFLAPVALTQMESIDTFYFDKELKLSRHQSRSNEGDGIGIRPVFLPITGDDVRITSGGEGYLVIYAPQEVAVLAWPDLGVLARGHADQFLFQDGGVATSKGFIIAVTDTKIAGPLQRLINGGKLEPIMTPQADEKLIARRVVFDQERELAVVLWTNREMSSADNIISWYDFDTGNLVYQEQFEGSVLFLSATKDKVRMVLAKNSAEAVGKPSVPGSVLEWQGNVRAGVPKKKKVGIHREWSFKYGAAVDSIQNEIAYGTDNFKDVFKLDLDDGSISILKPDLMNIDNRYGCQALAGEPNPSGTRLILLGSTLCILNMVDREHLYIEARINQSVFLGGAIWVNDYQIIAFSNFGQAFLITLPKDYEDAKGQILSLAGDEPSN